MADFSPDPGNKADGRAPNRVTVSGNTTVSSVGQLKGALVVSAAGALSAGMSGNNLLLSAPVQTVESQSAGISNLGNTLGTSGIASGAQVRFLLAGGNNITLSQSVNGASATITISGANTAAQTNQSAIKGLGVSNTGNTAGNTGLSSGVDWVIAGSNNITASESTTPGGPNTIWLSGPTTAAQTNQSAIKGLGVSNTGNTAGNTGLSTGIDWVIAGSNNVTVSESTVGGGPNTIWISGPNAGAGALSVGDSNVGNTVGDTAVVTGRLVLAGGNNITLSGSTNAGSMTITISAPNLGAGAMSAGASNLGNTAGATGVTGTRLVLVGSNAISLSQTTDANGGTITFNAPASSSLSATGLVSLSTNGAVISIGVPGTTLTMFEPFQMPITGSSFTTNQPASWWFNRVTLDANVVISNVQVPISFSAAAPGATSAASTGTARWSYSRGLTFFTRQNFSNSSSNISAITTASFGLTAGVSHSSTSQSFVMSWVTDTTGGTTSMTTTSNSNGWTAFLAGVFRIGVPLVTTLTPGEYFVAHAHSSTSATTNSNLAIGSASNFIATYQTGVMGLNKVLGASGTQASMNFRGQGDGVASAVTTNNTMALSVITASHASAGSIYMMWENF